MPAKFRTISVHPADYEDYERILDLLKTDLGMDKLKMPQAIRRGMILLRENLEARAKEASDAKNTQTKS